MLQNKPISELIRLDYGKFITKTKEMLACSLYNCLIVANKPNVKREKRKNKYYKEYYFNKKLFNSVKMASKMERTIMKQAAESLMKDSFSVMIANKMDDCYIPWFIQQVATATPRLPFPYNVP